MGFDVVVVGDDLERDGLAPVDFRRDTAGDVVAALITAYRDPGRSGVSSTTACASSASPPVDGGSRVAALRHAALYSSYANMSRSVDHTRV